MSLVRHSIVIWLPIWIGLIVWIVRRHFGYRSHGIKQLRSNALSLYSITAIAGLFALTIGLSVFLPLTELLIDISKPQGP